MPSRSAFNEQMTTSTRPHTPGRDRALAESCARRGQRAARVEFPLRFCAKRNPPKSKRRAADSWGRGFVGKDGGAMKRDPCVREAAETKHATGHNPRMQQDNVTSNRLTTASVVINTHTQLCNRSCSNKHTHPSHVDWPGFIRIIYYVSAISSTTCISRASSCTWSPANDPATDDDSL